VTASTTADRVALVLATITGEASRTDVARADWDGLAKVLDDGRDDAVWLTFAVLDSRFPDGEEVRRARRQIRTEGPHAFLRRWGRRRPSLRRRPPVEVVTDAMVLDVHHTARTTLATGIQRVVRQILQNWHGPATLVGWNPALTGLRSLSPEERDNATQGGGRPARAPTANVVVPWRSRYVLLELAVEDARTTRLAALAEFSGNATAVIGFDCVPLTSGETTGAGMGAAFARNLVAVSRFDQVIPISQAAGQEYSGWCRMLAGTGLTGPRITPLALPWEMPGGPGDPDAAAEALRVGDLPLLLCIGSHEPRKNHMAVLYAAEALWLEGCQFSLAFIGGNSWNSEHFETEVARLQEQGHPLRTATGLPDGIVAAAYRAATAVAFPSLNEGFGLPVSESLWAGTPVVTSAYGSMREIGEGRGAFLVNPRDDDSVLDGIRAVLFDQGTRSRLRGEIAAQTFRTWADYTRELQALLFGDR
jgi:glycosyltransferase involved in cell wall biosynthesis